MLRGSYPTIFICMSSFYTNEHWLLVESKLANQETVETTGLVKKCLLGNKAGAHLGGTMTTAAILGGTIGIGMTALPNELSSPEIDSSDKLDKPNISETTNDIVVFGMHPGIDGRNEGETKAKTDQSHADDDGRDRWGFDYKFGLDSQVLKSDNDNCSVQLIEAKKSDKKQRREIYDPRTTATSLSSNQGLRTGWDSRTGTKERIIKSVALVGTVALLTIALIVTTKNMRREIDIITESNTNITKILANMIEKNRLEKYLTRQEISLASRVCDGYPNITRRFVTRQNDSEFLRMNDCISHSNAVNFVADKHTCNSFLDMGTAKTATRLSMREHHFDRSIALFNRGMLYEGNVSNLNCAAMYDAFEKLIGEMTTLFKCGDIPDFEKQMVEASMKSCEMIRDGNMTISRVCRIHKILNHFQNENFDFIAYVGGALDPEMYDNFGTCVTHLGQKFVDKFYPKENDTAQI